MSQSEHIVTKRCEIERFSQSYSFTFVISLFTSSSAIEERFNPNRDKTFSDYVFPFQLQTRSVKKGEMKLK